MRKALFLLAPVSLMALAACGDSPMPLSDAESGEAVSESAAGTSSSADATANATTGEVAGLEGRPEIPLSLPKMAYVFDYGFRLAGEAIAPLQEEHAAMCEAQGPGACQIISLSRTGDEPGEVHGELQLAVAADRARGFGSLLSASAERAGAEAFRADIEGEELSKSIVDTEARLRTRIALRDRLMEVLETRRGTVEELVQAERSVAAVNEEIDQAQSWLAEQKGRVAYSRMTLSYEAANPGGSFTGPIDGAVGSLGAIFGTLAAIVIYLTAIAGPFVLGALGFRWLTRRREAALTEA